MGGGVGGGGFPSGGFKLKERRENKSTWSRKRNVGTEVQTYIKG